LKSNIINSLFLRNFEKDRSPEQLETMSDKYMRRAISVGLFGKAECSSVSTINKYIRNSVHFLSLWSRLAFRLSKMAWMLFFWFAFWVYLKSPCMWLLHTDILAGNAARQWHCW